MFCWSIHALSVLAAQRSSTLIRAEKSEKGSGFVRRVLTEPDQASLLLASFAALDGVLLDALVLRAAVI